MYNDFETAFYKPIDIVTVRSVRENWNIRSTRYLYRNIKNDKVLLYEECVALGGILGNIFLQVQPFHFFYYNYAQMRLHLLD